jgi:hypothetical protein
METLQRTLAAIGRYCNTPYICSLYGACELAQAFCRAAAVSGTLYMLCNGVSSVAIPSKEAESGELSSPVLVTVTTSEGNTVTCRSLIGSPEYFSAAGIIVPGSMKVTIARAVCVVRGTLFGDVSRCLLTISPNTPPICNPHPVCVVQLDETSGAAPDGYAVLYLSTLCTNPGADSVYVAVDASCSDGAGIGTAALQAAISLLTRSDSDLDSSEAASSMPSCVHACFNPFLFWSAPWLLGTDTADVPTKLKPQLLWSMHYLQVRLLGRWGFQSFWQALLLGCLCRQRLRLLVAPAHSSLRPQTLHCPASCVLRLTLMTLTLT